MRVATILGTRPEIIRLSLIIGKLDAFADRHLLIHTGQNFTQSLSGIFFEQLGLRKPDFEVTLPGHSLGMQLSAMFRELEVVLERERPDVVLLLGDTNSALSAVLVERMGIPVVHMEAGNRCYDLRVPEEKNRKIIDAVSSINMPYTSYSKANLLREGFPPERIVLTGNPIYEVMEHYREGIDGSDALERHALTPGDYLIVTAHRAENVDDPARLTAILNGLNQVAERFGKRLICSVHPRTRSRLLQGSVSLPVHGLVELHEPFGFFDFVRLERDAWCAVTDSGTVQEECCIMRVPTVTIRESTERPETVDCGSNAVCGLNPSRIADAVAAMTAWPAAWHAPEGYEARDVSDKVVKFLLGGKWDVQK
ncbi:UDP-N-acetylglucosamine 2-epimerase [Paenibacillus darwinianus]|uniref:UDP-N-acetylglucosamine 2-epimerase n=1 Tax=Paenibacillus darwinianus TaxID=1380763 RepID=A0A9W5S2G1_9BACL|nr:UDP-N-acetylglucosamine 2-epimerase (non-hydrolyzing) [Paenibacillus darwinianus]EXX89136.1 UDP-N-acetylglucosamine 2-epimerase [Paenibacillus darwinianus]EXX89565.1 UDP-N-acetylglucosamine 2-epimerase [Paenibacillus darwinianus]EXX89799.1 UDP-N-acetylglucosamine 2-epimerase [Paenibacillus darwinianus]